jgi:hypothetical protein
MDCDALLLAIGPTNSSQFVFVLDATVNKDSSKLTS